MDLENEEAGPGQQPLERVEPTPGEALKRSSSAIQSEPGVTRPPRSARARQRQYEQQRSTQPNWRTAELVVRLWESNFQKSVVAIARRLGLADADGEDVSQAILEWLADHPDRLDLNNPGWQSWVLQRAEYRLLDLQRKILPVNPPGGGSDLDDLAQRSESSEDACLDPTAPGTFGWLIERDGLINDLRRAGLTENQLEIFSILWCGFEMPLNDLAEILERSHGSVRQDKSRGERKLAEIAITHIGLTQEEHAVFSCWRRHDSIDEVVKQLGWCKDDVLKLLSEARVKVHKFLMPRQSEKRAP